MNPVLVRGLALVAVALPSAAGAGTIRLEAGALSLEFEDAGGAWISLAHEGREIARSPAPVRSQVTFASGPADRMTWLEDLGRPRRLLRWARPAPDRLELTVAAGDFEWTEHYEVRDDGGRLDRRVDFAWRGPAEVALRSFAFLVPGIRATTNGFYAFPAAWPPVRHALADLKPGTKRRGRGTLGAGVIELDPGLSLVAASMADDTPGVEIQEGDGAFALRQDLRAAGRLRPGVVQALGPVSLMFVRGGGRSGLERLRGWMGEAGLRLPADRAAWLGESSLYSFHPGGTIGSGWNDLGGFAAAARVVPPRMRRLGATAAWILPVEYRSPYWPLDYYRFMDGLGGSNEYRRLVDTLHAGGARVLQDIVPHGGAPQAEHNRAHPEFMLRREDGTTLDYWLNDFARPDWQAYVAAVAGYYVRGYDIDGYRVDACSGSKEFNWDPAIPYARASLAGLHGGLGMMAAIRAAVKAEKPDAALLAEVESERHLASAEATYDFTFGFRVCRDWRSMPAAEFVRNLRAFLDEQLYAQPPGAARLRFIESHDSTRAQGWYGVRGLRAMYALSAWIDGMPMIYQGMDAGHGPALAAIHRARNGRPELRDGTADYVSPTCDAPAVFAASRSKDGHATTFAINFGRDPVRARLTGGAEIDLRPLDYALLEERTPPAATGPAVTGPTEVLGDEVRFGDATEWFVDSVEGRLHDWFDGPSAAVPARGGTSSIYWRPQGRGDLWQNELAPLHPAAARLGVRGAGGAWRGYVFEGPAATNAIRLCDQSGGAAGLALVGAGGLPARAWTAPAMPAEPDVTAPTDLGGVSLRVVGPEYIVSNRHFTAILLRTGGVLREWTTAAGERRAAGQDFYGDQAWFETREARRMAASNEGETGIRVWRAADGLHLAFEGHLRGDYRFALKRPALVFRNEYVFTGGPSFDQRWSFRTEKPIRGVAAFLACNVREAAGDGFRFLRGGAEIARGGLEPGGGRKGVVSGGALPDTMVFERAGRPLWSLQGIRTPATPGCRAFLVGRMPFLTLLDGGDREMESGRDYDFACTWSLTAP